MPGDYRAPGSAAEWRLRLRLADAALKVADANGMEGALMTLVEISRGLDADGKPIRVSHRTRAIAAARLAAVLQQAVPGGVRSQAAPALPDPAPPDQRQQHLHLHLHGPESPGQPGRLSRAEWCAEYARALQALDHQAAAQAELAPNVSPNGNGHPAGTNGHATQPHPEPPDDTEPHREPDAGEPAP